MEMATTTLRGLDADRNPYALDVGVCGTRVLISRAEPMEPGSLIGRDGGSQRSLWGLLGIAEDMERRMFDLMGEAADHLRTTRGVADRCAALVSADRLADPLDPRGAVELRDARRTAGRKAGRDIAKIRDCALRWSWVSRNIARIAGTLEGIGSPLPHGPEIVTRNEQGLMMMGRVFPSGERHSWHGARVLLLDAAGDGARLIRADLVACPGWEDLMDGLSRIMEDCWKAAATAAMDTKEEASA